MCQLVFWTVKNQDKNIYLKVCWASIGSVNFSLDFKAFSVRQSHKEPIPHDKPFPSSWKSTFRNNDKDQIASALDINVLKKHHGEQWFTLTERVWESYSENRIGKPYTKKFWNSQIDNKTFNAVNRGWKESWLICGGLLWFQVFLWTLRYYRVYGEHSSNRSRVSCHGCFECNTVSMFGLMF